jgi:excisionase family DNA binding protein
MKEDTTRAGETCSHSSPTADSLRNQWGTVSGLATKYGCHPNTIRNWIHTGQLTAARFGPRMIRINEADLAALLRPYENGQAGQWAR